MLSITKNYVPVTDHTSVMENNNLLLNTFFLRKQLNFSFQPKNWNETVIIFKTVAIFLEKKETQKLWVLFALTLFKMDFLGAGHGWGPP